MADDKNEWMNDHRYWKIRRDIERLEALGCFILATVTTTEAVFWFWLIVGITCAFNVWTSLERRREPADIRRKARLERLKDG